MQKIISKYGLAAHLAILAVAPLLLLPEHVLWISALTVVWLVMEPSRIGSEMLHEARERVFSHVVRDPFFFIMLVVIALAGLRWINSGIDMVYDAENTMWSLTEPLMPLMPGAAKGFGEVEFAGGVAIALVLLGCRHALGKSARMAFLLIESAITGAIAVGYGWQVFNGDAEMIKLMNCPMATPSYIGMAFGIGLMAATIALLAAFERKWRLATPLALLGIAGNGLGLFLFAPAGAAGLFAVVDIVIFGYSFAYAYRALPGSGAFKYMVAYGMSIVTAVVLVIAALTSEALSEKIAPFLAMKPFTDQYLALRDTLGEIAMKVMKANLWIGTGLGTFPLDIRFMAEEKDWLLISVDQTMPLNGYWQLMSERGIVGAVMIACPLGMLLWTYSVKMVRGLMTRTLPHPSSWMGLLTLIAVLVWTAFDCSIFYPGMMIGVGSMIAVSANSFPKEKHNG